MPRLLLVCALMFSGPTLAQQSASPAVSGAAPICPALSSTVQADSVGQVSEHGVAFYRVDGRAPLPRSAPGRALEFTLRGPSRVRVNQALNMSLRVVNRSTTQVTLMRAMDGSRAHMRDPSYDLYLRRVGETAVYRWAYYGGRCGLLNPVAAEDYVSLAPGAANDTLPGPWASQLQDATLGVPGEYEAWVVYRFCEGVGGGAAQGPAPLQGEFASNAVRFRVR